MALSNTFLPEQLSNQYNTLITLVTPLDTAFLQTRFRPNKWSIHENLAHLGRYQEIFWDRIETIRKEKEPMFDRYKAEQDHEFANWCKKETSDILLQTQSFRTSLIGHIAQMKEEDFLKVGHHPKFKNLTVKNWIEFFLLHESHHIYTIFRIIHEFNRNSQKKI